MRLILLLLPSLALAQPIGRVDQGRGQDGGAWSVGNTTTGTAVAVRCVNTAGNAFEACGGAGASGLTNAELRAAVVPVSLASTTLTGTSTVAISQTTTANDVDVLTLPALATGANVIGALSANQSTNVAQMGGVATAMNTGARSTGTQRVTIATDDVVPASQSGTWTVQPGNTANSTPWLTTDTPRTVASANNTGTCVSVTASTTVLASNASRRAYGFKASEDNTAKVHCKLGATATTASTIFGAGAGWSQDTGAVYTGVIDCIAASGTQSVCPYELN